MSTQKNPDKEKLAENDKPPRSPRSFEQKLLELLLEEGARMRQYKKGFIHIAIVTKRKKILSIAFNRIGSRQSGCGFSDYTIHAERNAIKQVGDMTKLNGANLYVIRVSNKDSILNSEPCHDCRLLIEKCQQKYGLRNVYYSI